MPGHLDTLDTAGHCNYKFTCPIAVLDKNSTMKYTYRYCVRPTAPGLVRTGSGSIPPAPLADFLESEGRDSAGMVAGCVKYYSTQVNSRGCGVDSKE